MTNFSPKKCMFLFKLITIGFLFLLLNCILINKTNAQCATPPNQNNYYCSGGNGVITNNVNINNGTYWYTATGSLNNVNIGGGALVICGDLTINSGSFNGGTIIIKQGGKLRISTSSINCIINNFGTLYINANLTLNGSARILNASTGIINMNAGNYQLACDGQLVNYGVANIYKIKTQGSSQRVCLGADAVMNISLLETWAPNTWSVSSGTACVSFTGQANINNGSFTNSSNLKICKKSGATKIGSGNWGSAVVTDPCTSCSPSLNVSVTATPNSICSGNTTTLSASIIGGTSQFSYYWSNSSLIGANPTSPTLTNTTTYTVTVTDNSGSTATGSVVVTVKPLPTANAGENQLICSGQSTNLTATGGTTYVWNTNDTSATINVSPTTTSTYTVLATNNICTATDDVIVIVNPLPTVNAGNDQTVCAGTTVTLSASGGTTYQWSNIGSVAQSISVFSIQTTTYIVTASYNTGCSATDDVIVNVNSIPLSRYAVSLVSSNICQTDNFQLTASSCNCSYLWSTGETTQSIIISDTSDFRVKITDENGCSNISHKMCCNEPDSIYWYSYNKRKYYVKRRDVFAFRYKPNYQPPISVLFNSNLGNLIDSFAFDTSSHTVEIYIKQNSSIDLIEQLISVAVNDSSFDCEYNVVSKEYSDPIDKTLILNDEIRIIFKNPTITKNEVRDFAIKYNLDIIVKPDFVSEDISGLYIFQLKNKFYSSSYIARKIFECDSNIILTVGPNIENFVIPNSQSSNSQVSYSTANDGNTCWSDDTYYNKTWHIFNNGTLKSSSNTSATKNADAKVCECWDAGYSGYGVKIGVIDGDVFQFDHEDLAGQIINGWDGVNNVEYTPDSQFAPPTLPDGKDHANAVAGVISAIRYNNKGLVGVAPSSKIVPYRFKYGIGSGAQISKLFNNILENIDKIDIINMSFEFADDVDDVHKFFQYLVNNGRPSQWDYSKKNGIILVASSGNSNAERIQYPAAYEEVISVIGTNPDDKRYSSTDSWCTNCVGSSYGFTNSLAAPGSRIVVPTSYGFGQPSYEYNYANTNGSSLAAGIVSGIVAILLSKNMDLNWMDIKNTLETTADKVHPDIYNYNENSSYPGKSKEMGNGRINCIKALNATPTSIAKLDNNSNLFKINTIANDYINITTELDKGNIKYQIQIFDILGQLVYSDKIETKGTSQNINISNFSEGVYILIISSLDQKIIKKEKIIKS